MPRYRKATGIALAALAVALLANISGSLTNAKRAQNNCRKIENVKQFIRQSVEFDEEEFSRSMADFGIDPQSERADHFRQRAKANAKEIQERFAPNSCPFSFLPND